eukprot:3730746-Pyramimonas_sp.AAC.1
MSLLVVPHGQWIGPCMHHAVIHAFIVGQDAYELDDVSRRNYAVLARRHISFAERQIAIQSRSKFFTLATTEPSASTRRPDWILSNHEQTACLFSWRYRQRDMTATCEVHSGYHPIGYHE